MNLYRWADLAVDELMPGIAGRMIVAERMMLCWFQYEPGINEPTHRHESEQFSYVVKGRVRFLSEEEEIEAGPGDVVHFPSNVPHSALVLDEGAEVIEIFSPIRPDLLSETDKAPKGNTRSSE